jgi:Helix-turn-helix domain
VLLTQVETAELLRLSERTLERWRVVGGGPVFCKLGKRVLYRRDDLEKLIALHVVHTHPLKPRSIAAEYPRESLICT